MVDHGIIWIEGEVMRRSDCMVASLCPLSIQVRINHSAMSVASREDWDGYLQERLCKVPLGMRMLAPPTLVVIKEIIESLVDSRVSALKKGQTILAIEGSIL